MIQFRFDPRTLTGQQQADWMQWEQDARLATVAVIKAFEQWNKAGAAGKFAYAFDEKIWKRLRDFMLQHVFFGKCAYCETREARSPYHAEHFRPKGMVRYKTIGKEALEKAMTEAEAGVRVEHPGYFWLAYHWKNLLPSCAFCNAHEGKKNQFPTGANRYLLTARLKPEELQQCKEDPIPSQEWPGMYYLLPDDLNPLEDPLLVHPLVDDPRRHICFGDCGVEAPVNKSPKGEYSIAVYNLGAEALRAERQRAQEEGENRFIAAKASCRNATLEQRRKAGLKAIESFIEGREPYSAAVLDYITIAQGVKFP